MQSELIKTGPKIHQKFVDVTIFEIATLGFIKV